MLGLADHDDHRQAMDFRFTIAEKLGEGTYGKVYKAVDKHTQQEYALKKIKIVYDGDGEGVPGTAIREVSLLKECDHENVIKLYEVYFQPNALFLLFEYADMDLQKYLKRYGRFSKTLKPFSFQLFRGLAFLHSRRMVHRDLKPQNVLVNLKRQSLKLADFGLARRFEVPLQSYTHEVVTLWYRAPEVLLGQVKYGTPIDVWSLGCIVCEMATAQALFPGDSEIDTVFKIFRLLGTPTADVWPGVELLADFKKTYPKWNDTDFESVRSKDPALDDDGFCLLRACLTYNPVDRASSRRLLQHPYFDSLFPACEPGVSPLKLPPPPPGLLSAAKACATATAPRPIVTEI